MKALIVTPYYHPKIGGLETYARQLGLALKSQENWEIVIATSNHNPGGTITDIIDGQKIYRLRTLVKFSNTPINPLWPFLLRRIIKTEKPDLILAHTPVPSMADAVALSAGHTPIFLTYHAATLLKGNSRLFNSIARIYGVYERLTLSRASRIIVVSDYVKTGLSTKFHDKIDVVPNAVWQASIRSRQQPAASSSFVFISSLDRTHAWKGLEYILEAISYYKYDTTIRPHLTVIGDGNYRAYYQQKSELLGIKDCVTFVGAKTGAAKNALIAQATALICYPTTANDAFPTVMLEAWALSVPVIAASIGPIPSLITDGRDGYLVEPANPKKLAEKLQIVASSKVSERAAVAESARIRTLAEYTWERQAQAIANLAARYL